MDLTKGSTIDKAMYMRRDEVQVDLLAAPRRRGGTESHTNISAVPRRRSDYADGVGRDARSCPSVGWQTEQFRDEVATSLQSVGAG